MISNRARNPRWWDLMFEYYYPRVYLGILDKWVEEKPGFRNFVKNLPSKCPFERQYWLWGQYLILYVPALCKFNPLFSQLMELKMRIKGEEMLYYARKEGIKNKIEFSPPTGLTNHQN